MVRSGVTTNRTRRTVPINRSSKSAGSSLPHEVVVVRQIGLSNVSGARDWANLGAGGMEEITFVYARHFSSQYGAAWKIMAQDCQLSFVITPMGLLCTARYHMDGIWRYEVAESRGMNGRQANGGDNVQQSRLIDVCGTFQSLKTDFLVVLSLIFHYLCLYVCFKLFGLIKYFWALIYVKKVWIMPESILASSVP